MMNIPIQITVRDFELPEAARTAIQEKVEKLDTFYEKIMSCRVVVETPHRRQQKGVLYNVRIDMGIPGADLVVKREPHEDLYVAIREAFDAARRQLHGSFPRQANHFLQQRSTRQNFPAASAAKKGIHPEIRREDGALWAGSCRRPTPAWARQTSRE